MFFEAIILVALASIVVVCWRLRQLVVALVALLAMYPSVAAVLLGLSDFMIELPGTFLLTRSGRLVSLLSLTVPPILGWLITFWTLRRQQESVVEEPPLKTDRFTLKEVQQLFLLAAVAGGARMLFFTG